LDTVARSKIRGSFRLIGMPAIYCGRATWSLALYGQKDYLLASIRDRKDTQHIDIKKACVSRLFPSLVAMLSQLNGWPHRLHNY